MSHQDDALALMGILARRSLRVGDFKLSAGQTSGVYVDAKLTTCCVRAMPLIGRVFLDKMHARSWFPEAIGGLTVGADPIAFATARESFGTDHEVNSFIVRKEPKKHGMQRFIEGMEETSGRSVVIIDDVCTTGGSTTRAIEKAQEAGMHILGAICLVDRQHGATERLAKDFNCELLSIFTLSELVGFHESELSAVGAHR
jgi:orotate phosphoribosyltransferase